MRVLKARVEVACGPPGSVLKLDGDGPLIAAGEGALRLLEVQPAGRKAMNGADYARGRHLAPGDRLG
jgi:methionyl-tRNA formyltransferase